MHQGPAALLAPRLHRLPARPARVRRRYLVGHGSRTPARDVRALLLAAAAAAGRADVVVAPADPWTPAAAGAGGGGGAEMDTGRAVRELRGGRPLTPAAETVRAMADAVLRLG